MRMATGSAITKPSAKPAPTLIRLLARSSKNAPFFIMRARPSMVTGANGKARPVRSPMLIKYQTARATSRDIIPHAQAGILLAQEFLLFLNSGLPFLN